MPDGFFSLSTVRLVNEPPTLIARCGACGLSETCLSPKMEVHGEGKRKVLVLGEAPGKIEDEVGRQFVGPAGQRLRQTLKKINISLDKDCWTSNSLLCRPPKNKTPDNNKIDFCRPNLTKTIEALQPNVIITLGAIPIRSVMGGIWIRTSKVGEVSKWVGWQIPCQKPNMWVTPTFHPSWILRLENGKDSRAKIAALVFEKHLKAAFDIKSKPWPENLPDYTKQIEVVMDVEEAAKRVRKLAKGSRAVAFDYETNTLKPDAKHASIICCSVSDGKETIAYPFYGAVKEASKELVISDVPKIASNMKFEQRWTMAKLGVRVKNFAHDTMLCAHCLDTRGGISSIKFQAFVLLGAPLWNQHIDELLDTDEKEKRGNSRNNIHQIDLQDLLKYCAVDSLLEWRVSQEQMRILGI